MYSKKVSVIFTLISHSTEHFGSHFPQDTHLSCRTWLRGLSEPSRERCAQSSLWCRHPSHPSQSWGEGRAHCLPKESLSPIKSYTKAWILCKMLEKNQHFCCLPTPEERQSPGKTLGNWAQWWGESALALQPALLTGWKRTALSLGSGLFCTVDFTPQTQKSLCSETDVYL